MPETKQKIAVLGGGLSAMTAIYTLMQEPNAKEKYDITVYQLGWRIGGKGASGVNTKIGSRIEEHGLHLWMGFYENAFRAMKSCYAQLNRPYGAPLATFEEAFKPQDNMTFAENVKGEWRDWKINFPELPGHLGDGIMPGTPEFVDMWFDFLIEKIKEWIGKHFEEHGSEKKKNLIDSIVHWFEEKIDQIESGLEEKIVATGEKLLRELQEHIKSEQHDQDAITSAIDNFKRWIWDLVGDLVEENDLARRIYIILDLGMSLIHGMVKDGVLHWKDGKLEMDYDVINEYDYREWLVKNGAHPEITAYCPFVTAMYDGPFAFKRGNALCPDVEAGTSLRIFFRLAFTCKEHVIWRMQAGMGDTIFAPWYELLVRDYGVKFKFFHEVKSMKLSTDKSEVDKIIIAKQVDLKIPDLYEPLVDVKGLPCWPSEPVYKYIEDEQAEYLQKNNINLEMPWSDWEAREIFELKKGVDFDTIIIGFSIASIPEICSELVDAFPSWYNMLEHVQAVQTQSWQLWFNADAAQLGIADDKLLSTYVETMDTFSAMNQLLDREDWPKENLPKYIVYLCGAMQQSYLQMPFSSHTFPERQINESRQRLLEYIEKDFSHLIPDAYDKGGNFKWELLVDLNDGTGSERLNAQYVRPNIAPTDHYVLSVTGSSKFRLKTDDTGCHNLFITGDWIQNGFNAGFVEGAVVAGLTTARAVSGNPNIPIIGEDFG